MSSKCRALLIKRKTEFQSRTLTASVQRAELNRSRRFVVLHRIVALSTAAGCTSAGAGNSGLAAPGVLHSVEDVQIEARSFQVRIVAQSPSVDVGTSALATNRTPVFSK